MPRSQFPSRLAGPYTEMGHEPKCPKDGSYVVKSVLGNFVGAEVRIVTSGMANMIGPLPQFAEFRFENPRCVGSSRPAT